MSKLAKAFDLYKVGNFAGARKIARSELAQNKRNPKVFHLLAIIAKGEQNWDLAIKHIEAANRMLPDDVSTLYEKGSILKEAGYQSKANASFEACLTLAPGHLNSSILSGNYWLTENYPERALEIFKKGLLANPEHPTLLRGKLFALKDIQDFDGAWDVLKSLSQSPDLEFTKGQIYLESFRPEKAALCFEKAIETSSTSSMAFRNLMQVKYMTGGIDGLNESFENLSRRYPQSAELWLRGADVFRDVGQYEKALECLEFFEQKFGFHPLAAAALAGVYVEMDDGDRAIASARKALAIMPEDLNVNMRLCQSALMTGEFDLVLKTAQRFKKKNRKNSFWIAMEATALRAKGNIAAYNRLVDYKKCVAVYDILPPPGYDTQKAFLKELKAQLLNLHEWKSEPLYQSLRGGTQTSADLRHSKVPVIRSFFDHIWPLIEGFVEGLPSDKFHPFYGHKSNNFRIAGAWSVALKPGGFHVNHIHPEGWISSSFYVDVPDNLDENHDKEGWIQFGAPPFKVKDLGPEHFIRPKPGRLVLFPSYFWHGTVPFQKGELRLTLPFDLKPA